MYRVTESQKNLIPQTVPTSTSVQSYLNNVWGKQANVQFTVTGPQDVSVHYDLLPDPDGDGTLNDFKGVTDINFMTEENAFLTAIPATSYQGNNLEVNYINAIGSPIGGTWTQGHTVEGISLTSSHLSWVQDTQAPLNQRNSRENITAHEIGHALGRGGDDERPRYKNKNLMWGTKTDDDPQNPCEVRRADWQKLNPTPGDDGN